MTVQCPQWAVRLRHEREARGWNKKEMARRLLRAAGLNQGNIDNLARQIRRWEDGTFFPRDWADAYATAFDVDIRELFGPEGNGSGAFWAHDPHADDDDVKRRTMLGLLATATATAAAVPL
ncbi:MAG TPA: helix-turn-helix transcriptional regulator, partial [Thermomonospora sp.]|nr:helix-turn-helix transcriptional regulator [Thermomonospora sp.]